MRALLARARDDPQGGASSLYSAQVDRPHSIGGESRHAVTLFDSVAEVLEKHSIPYALIGAAALAVHGISRSTLDQDVLVTDTMVFAKAVWQPLGDFTSVDIRRGDDADPLAGVVRLERAGERTVDVVV